MNSSDSDPTTKDHPQIQPIKISTFPANKKPIKQILKERPRIFHQYTISDEVRRRHWFTSEQRLPKTIFSLNHLKSLKYLNLDIQRMACIHHQDLNKMIKSLKHLQNHTVLHFKDFLEIDKRKIGYLSKVLRKIDDLLTIKIRLSLKSISSFSSELFENLLRTFGELKQLVSVSLDFSDLVYQRHGSIEILSETESLCQLSLTFCFQDFSVPFVFKSLFNSLKKIKSLKYVRIYFKNCDNMNDFRIQDFMPIFKDAVKVFSLDIIYEIKETPSSKVEWKHQKSQSSSYNQGKIYW